MKTEPSSSCPLYGFFNTYERTLQGLHKCGIPILGYLNLHGGWLHGSLLVQSNAKVFMRYPIFFLFEAV